MTATEHLDRLAEELANIGWSSTPCYEEIPALLRVWHPDLPVIGESVASNLALTAPRGSCPQPVSPLPRALK